MSEHVQPYTPTNRFGNPGASFTQGNTKTYRDMLANNLQTLETTRKVMLATRRALKAKIMKMNIVLVDVDRDIEAMKKLVG